MEYAKLKYNNDYLQVFMPNGEIIPYQTDILIKNESGQRKMATVTMELIVDISEIGEKDSIYSEKVSRIQYIEKEKIKLEEEISSYRQSNEYLKKELRKEQNKKWYQKLFRL